MNGNRREIPVTSPERELQWYCYSPSLFLASTANRPRPRPRPLSSFDIHARWRPVSQSILSRRYHVKIGDCEQSIDVSEPLLKRDTLTWFSKATISTNQHIILTLFCGRRLREVPLCMYVSFPLLSKRTKKSVWERVRVRNRKVLVYFEGNTPPVTPYDVDNVHVCMNSEATLHSC